MCHRGWGGVEPLGAEGLSIRPDLLTEQYQTSLLSTKPSSAAPPHWDPSPVVRLSFILRAMELHTRGVAQADAQTRRMWGWRDLSKGSRNHQRLLRARSAMSSQRKPVSMATHSLQACAHQHPQTQCSEESSDQWVSLQPGLLEASPVGPLNPGQLYSSWTPGPWLTVP